MLKDYPIITHPQAIRCSLNNFLISVKHNQSYIYKKIKNPGSFKLCNGVNGN